MQILSLGTKKMALNFLLVLLATIVLAVIPRTSFAIPTLQLYIEGATYDPVTETWITGDSSFTLWVLGDVGAYGNISNIFLSAAYSSSETGTITLTPTTASGLPSPGDPSTPGAPTLFATGSGTSPLMGNGSPLPSHGIYGAGTDWSQYSIGNFTLTDSPIGDYTSGACPGPSCTYPDLGQINAYDVTVTGYSSVHFDAFDSIVLAHDHVRYVFAPFSHDAQCCTQVPEPTSLLLMGSGLVALGLWRRLSRARS